MVTQKKKVSVIGHKNPDTDSICSAIAYARLKRMITGELYEARRAGHLNAETKYILERFGVKEPDLLEDVATQVKDIEIRETKGVSSLISLKKAWKLMHDAKIVTLPITRDEKLEGLITIGDIATAYMDVHDNWILATAHTPYRNILETLDGTMIYGDSAASFVKGKVLIAAANPDLMEDYIDEHDMVILGNRYESQLCAIEMNADCIIVCEGAKVSLTIKKLAEERNCTVISTPHDTYTVARLINQSMPVAHFMTSDYITSFQVDAYIEDIKHIMAKQRTRDFPILDAKRSYCGMISRRNLMNMQRKKIIMVDHNEKSQAVDGIEEAEILEIIDHHRIGAIETMSPVYFRNEPVGCTATIVYKLYKQHGKEIDAVTASLLCSAIISDTLMYRSPTCTLEDKMAAEDLARLGGLDVTAFAAEIFEAASNLKLMPAEEIFYQDFKCFMVGDINFGVGQINSMNAKELEDIRSRLYPYLEKALLEQDVDAVVFMLTNIIQESTDLLFAGNSNVNIEEILEGAFQKKIIDNYMYLEGVVSRKKQLIPALLMAIQQ